MTPKPHRLSSCHRHPTIPVTGFCAHCLRERLAGIQSPSADNRSPPPPELRRTKSLSGDSPSASSAAVEPRRRSCEVGTRSTLSDLFTVDDAKKKPLNRRNELKSANSGFETVNERHNEETVRVCEDEEETKTMKEFIDLELRNQKGRDSRRFWDAASVFSEKLMKWKWNHKLMKRRRFAAAAAKGNGHGGVGLIETQTQSEVGEYGLGRRSCDTDPRFSMDVGRISVDNDSRVSFEAPRASWDGVLIGKPCHRLSPMVSVVEDANDSVLESGGEGSSSSPGGSFQTKDYYRSRRSFDRLSSHNRRQSISEVDELKTISNAKVSPASTELFYGAKLLISKKDLNLGDEKVANVKSLSDAQSDCVMGSASKDAPDVATGVSQKGSKKLHKWRRVWSKLGLVHNKREDKLREGGECEGDVVNKRLAEPWQKLRKVVNAQASESVSQKLIRSYSVSCRNPCRMAGLISSLGGTETKGNVLNGRQDFMLQRNRSVSRYSPNNLDTGLLRFYLTPLKSYRRSKSGKSSLKELHPMARSIF